jgi:hypothetical protein
MTLLCSSRPVARRTRGRCLGAPNRSGDIRRSDYESACVTAHRHLTEPTRAHRQMRPSAGGVTASTLRRCVPRFPRMSMWPGESPARSARPGPAASSARAARTPPKSGPGPGARASRSKTAAGYLPSSSSSSRQRPRSKTRLPPLARQSTSRHVTLTERRIGISIHPIGICYPCCADYPFQRYSPSASQPADCESGV